MKDRTRSVVVTGGSAGIGRAIASRLIDDGWFVVNIDRNSTSMTADSLHSVLGDVSDPAALAEARQAAEDAAPLRGWVNNAAINHRGELASVTMEDFRRVIDTNLGAVVLGAQAAVDSFLQSGVDGSIVNVSSIHARAAFHDWTVYDASKGGVEALTRNVCVAFAHRGIRCNAVAPGGILTERTQELELDTAIAEPLTRLSPSRRFGRAEEVASAVSWLLSDESTYVNGHVLRVDGGAAARCVDWADGV